MPFQFRERFVDGEEFVRNFKGRQLYIIQGDAFHLTAALLAAFSSRAFDKNATHGFGGGGKEMSAAVPLLWLVVANEPKISFMHERGCLQRLPRFFKNESLGGQLAQLVVHERQKLFGCRGVASFDSRQDACDVPHGGQHTARGTRWQKRQSR